MSFERYIDPTAQNAAEHCGNDILKVLEERLSGEPTATLAISGGSTPGLMFEHMAKARFNWSRVRIFWVDERAVPPTESQSNYRLANETLLSRFVHRIEAELKPDKAASRYKEEMQSFFGLASGEMPRFDVIHRGIGPDAHTAGLFPGEPLIDDRENLVAAVWVEKLKQWRITMLPGVLLAARHTMMLVCGADKAEAVKIIFDGPFDAKKYAAQALEHQGRGSVGFLTRRRPS